MSDGRLLPHSWPGPALRLRSQRSEVSGVAVRLPAELRLDLERARGVVHLHDHLDELDARRARELRVVEQVRELRLRAHRVRLHGLALLAAERVEQLRPLPADVRDNVSISSWKRGW